MVFVQQANEFSEMLDRWGWLSGILFLWIFIPKNQIVEAW